MRRSARMVGLVVGVGLAARLAHLAFIRDLPYYDLCTVWEDSDMYQFIAWARHLAAGDWLDADTFRPYFGWQSGIATAEVWSTWFGAHVYYQPPLYPYLLGGFLALSGSLDQFRLAQLLLGAVNCGMLALLGARLLGRPVGWIAGLGAALYGPFIVYDLEVLRGTVVLATQLLLLMALARGVSRESPVSWRRWAPAAGLAMGLAYIADPAILVFGPPAVLWVWWSATASEPLALAGRERAARALGAPVLFLAGTAVALLPLVARNFSVGAPPLSSTTRGPLAFVMGNAPDANPEGAFLPESTRRILSASGYGMAGTIAETLRLYEGDYSRLLGKQWRKMKTLWGDYEVPDNPSFYYAAHVSPVARWGLRFLPVAAFGLMGLGLLLLGSIARPDTALLPLFLLSCNGLFLMAHVVSRYRQPMVIPLLILAAAGLVEMWRLLRGARGGFAWPVPAYLASCVLLMMLLPKAPPAGYGYTRSVEFELSASLYAERGEIDKATAEMNTLIARARQEPDLLHAIPAFLYKRGLLQADAGRHQEAVDSFREVLRADPGFQEAATALSQSLRAMGAPEEPGSAP